MTLAERLTVARPLYIFDLDGTLALIEHRLHFIQNKPKDWRGFFAACIDDVPNPPVIATFKALRKSAEVWIWSGRSDEVREETKAWLYKHGLIHAFWNPLCAPEAFRMRKAGDYRDDAIVKAEWLAEMEPPERNRLTAIFDDRARVVEMWRSFGVPAFQVAPGDF